MTHYLTEAIPNWPQLRRRPFRLSPILQDTSTHSRWSRPTCQMGPVVYKDHTIIASGDLDEVSGTYIPMASINWIKSDGKRAVHVLTDSLKRFNSFEEASNFAVDSAKVWVDRRRSAQD